MHDYLRRTGVSAPIATSAEGLRRLHVAHREAFLFENLSIQTGGSISVELEDIERKFLDEGRGGYCFEHNTLFGAALAEAGFAPVALLGRVRRGPPARWARTHMVLRVDVPDGSPERRSGQTYLADVGFGATGLVEPIPLRHGASSTQRGITYTLRRDGLHWVLAMRDTAGVQDLYEFAEEPQTPGDIDVANHYTSTHPESIFRKTLTIQRVRDGERVVLRNATLSRWIDGRPAEETVDRRALGRIARDLFDIELPDGPFVFEARA